jgi:hypothetical protein
MYRDASRVSVSISKSFVKEYYREAVKMQVRRTISILVGCLHFREREGEVFLYS